MERKSLILGLAMVVIAIVLVSFIALPTMADEKAYSFDCRDVVYYDCYVCQQPTRIVPNDFGGATVTMPVDSMQFTLVELGCVPGDTYAEKGNNVRRAIENGAPVDFYNSADGSYRPFKLYKCRDGFELRIALNESTTPEPGVGVGGRIRTVIDGHDGNIYFHLSDTLVTKGTVQENGEEIALTPFGYTPCY